MLPLKCAHISASLFVRGLFMRCYGSESLDYIAKDPHLDVLIVNLDDADRKRETRRMLIGSDGRLNLLLGFDDSLQKVLTQTILSQEEDFRNQVLL